MCQLGRRRYFKSISIIGKEGSAKNEPYTDRQNKKQDSFYLLLRYVMFTVKFFNSNMVVSLEKSKNKGLHRLFLSVRKYKDDDDVFLSSYLIHDFLCIQTGRHRVKYYISKSRGCHSMI